MKLHLIMYLINIAKDLKVFLKYSKFSKNNKFLVYYSDIIEKIQLSSEMIFEIIYSGKNVKLFDKKKFVMLILELVRMGFRFRELKYLSDLGYNFYIEKNIYLEQLVEVTNKEEFLARLELTK
jgi:hypothetical protein